MGLEVNSQFLGRVTAISMDGFLQHPRQNPEKPHGAWGEWRSLHRTWQGEATEVGREQPLECQGSAIQEAGDDWPYQMLQRPRKI